MSWLVARLEMMKVRFVYPEYQNSKGRSVIGKGLGSNHVMST